MRVFIYVTIIIIQLMVLVTAWNLSLSPANWTNCDINIIPYRIFLSKAIKQVKSGDMVLFNDNIKDVHNIMYGNNKFSHSGMIIVINNEPYVYEIVAKDYVFHRNVNRVIDNDVKLSLLSERASNMSGNVFICPLMNALTDMQCKKFTHIINSYNPAFLHNKLKLLSIALTNKSWKKERFCHEFTCELMHKLGITSIPMNVSRINLSKSMLTICDGQIYNENIIQIIPDNAMIDNINVKIINNFCK